MLYMIIKDKNKLNEFVDCLLEAFFNGAVNIEENLPPGFSSADIEDVEDYTKSSDIKEEEFPGLDATSVKKQELEPMLQKKKEMGGKADHETPYIHKSEIKVIDDNNKEIDLEYLRKLITQRPKEILSQNEKIEKSGGKQYVFYKVTLPAYKGLWYDEKNKEFKIVTTCPSAGMCKQICYARKGAYVQFKVSFTSSARILNFLLNDWQGFKTQLTREIEQAYGKHSKENVTTVIRWHDSGDFFNEKYLQIALDIAKATPNVLHYAYTKQVNMVKNINKPKNFVFNYSLGGTQDTNISSKDKKSIIVPRNIFWDLFPQGNANWKDIRAPITPEMLQTLRERLSKAYNIRPDSIITYKQMISTPDNNKPKWNVIVKPGDGDDAAVRRDVISTLLFVH